MTFLSKISYFLICATVVFTTLAYGTVHQPIVLIFYVLAAALIVIWSIDGMIRGEMRLSMSYLQLPLLAFGVYAVMQIAPIANPSEPGGISGIPRTISIDPFSTEMTALHIFALAAFFFAALIFINSAHRVHRLASVLTVFGFCYAFYAILQSVLSPEAIFGIYRPESATPFGSFVNKHDYAAIIEMTMAIPLGLLFTGRVARDKRLIYIVAVLIMGCSLLLSGSRGGLVAVIAEVILLVILTTRSRGRNRMLLTAGLSLLLIIAAVGGAVFVGGETSLTRFANATEQANISSDRGHIWAVTLEVIRQYLPLGAGIGAFGQAYTALDSGSGSLRVEQAHNDYLQIVADAGVIGLIIGLAFLYLFVRQAMAAIRTENSLQQAIGIGTIAGCFAILVHSLFDFVLHVTAVSVMFLVLLALMVSAGRKYDDEIEGEQERSRRRRKSKGSVSRLPVTSA